MEDEENAQTRTIVAVVLTVLVILLGLLLFMTEYSIIDDDEQEEPDVPDDDYPDWLQPPPLILDKDIEWTGKDELLSNPIIITEGTTLMVEHSDIRVELIDLVLGNQSWITIEKGGRLKMVNSNLSIVYEEWLEDAVVASGYRYKGRPYSISRAVNLEGAEEPILSFDLRWYLGSGNVTVAVQRSPGSELIELCIIEPGANLPDGWTHHSIPLTDYAGQVVRVIVFTDDEGYKDVIVGRIEVTDSGSDLPNDAFPTGRAWEDGWRCDKFGPFFFSMVREMEYWQALIEAMGDVELIQCQVTAPEGLERYDFWYSSSKYQPQRFEDPPMNRGPAWSTTSGGGHILVQEARFVAERTGLTNVPVIVQDGEVEILDSRFEGDADLLALDRSHGNVTGSFFWTRPFHDKQRDIYPRASRIIGTGIDVSFENPEGPIRIDDCSIKGSYKALDLNQGWVELNSCTIDSVDWISIWNHETRGLGTWEQILASNSIDVSGVYRYFKTHTAVFEMEGVGRPLEGSMYGVFTGIIDWGGMEDYGYSLNNRIIHVDPYRTYILMPTLTVDKEGVAEEVEQVIVHSYVSWGGAEYVHLNTSVREGTIQIDPALADSYSYWDTDTEYKFIQSFGGGPGRVTIGLDVDVPGNYSEEFWLILYLDGEVKGVYHGRDANDSRWGGYEGVFNHTFTVPTGLHALGIELLGLSSNELDPTQLLNDTKWYYRASEPENLTEAQEFVKEERGTVLLDPGLRLAIDVFAPNVTPDDRYYIHCLLSNGSSFSIQGEEVPSPNRIYIKASGPGMMGLYDFDVDYLNLYLYDLDLDLANVTSTIIHLNLDGGEHCITDLWGRNETSMSATDVSSLVMANSAMASSDDWWDTHLSLANSHATIENLTVRDNGDLGVYVDVWGNSSFAISNSTFEGTGLAIYPSYQGRTNATILVTDCTFTGDGAFLWVQDQMYYWNGEQSFLPGSRIQGNRFKGEGTKLVCQRHLMDWILVDNELDDGTDFYVSYDLTFKWPEGHSPGDYYYKLQVDEGIIEISSQVLGHDWEQWEPIFAVGTVEPISVVDPEPILILILGDYNIVGFSTVRWVMGFSHIDPTETASLMGVPQWESIDVLLRSHYGEDWNQGT